MILLSSLVKYDPPPGKHGKYICIFFLKIEIVTIKNSQFKKFEKNWLSSISVGDEHPLGGCRVNYLNDDLICLHFLKIHISKSKPQIWLK